jgi:hypothetical protein
MTHTMLYVHWYQGNFNNCIINKIEMEYDRCDKKFTKTIKTLYTLENFIEILNLAASTKNNVAKDFHL